jgi:hypothetical protein
MPASDETMVLQVLSFFGFQLAMPLLLLQVNDVVRGLKPSLTRSLKVYGSDRIWPFIGTYVVVTLSMALGFVCLIIPGLIVTTLYLFAMIIATLEDKTVSQSMRKSRMLGKGCYVRNVCVFYASCFALGLPVMIAFMLLGVVIGATAGWLFPMHIYEGGMVLNLLDFVIMILASVIVPALVLPQILLYYDMRARKEGLDDNRFVEELRVAGFDAEIKVKEGAAWTPARS